jgi:hypothetical protein
MLSWLIHSDFRAGFQSFKILMQKLKSIRGTPTEEIEREEYKYKMSWQFQAAFLF